MRSFLEALLGRVCLRAFCAGAPSVFSRHLLPSVITFELFFRSGAQLGGSAEKDAGFYESSKSRSCGSSHKNEAHSDASATAGAETCLGKSTADLKLAKVELLERFRSSRFSGSISLLFTMDH